MIDEKILNKLACIHVLIVEDDQSTLEALKQNLEMYCKKVDTATNGLSGYELFKSKKPDIVITDINMPKLSGHEMVASLREISPHVPIIIMTSYDSSENMLKSIEEGAYSYLRKPIKIEELQTAILMATKNIYNKIIYLNEGYRYECETKGLYLDNELIKFTKTEQDLINLLMQNINKIISYETIENFVWVNKSMSREALRMCIKKIRAKTYPKIIENIQQQGYKISSAD